MLDLERLTTPYNRNNIKTNRTQHTLTTNIIIRSRQQKTNLLTVNSLLRTTKTIRTTSLNLHKHRHTIPKSHNVYILVTNPIVRVQQQIPLLYQIACCHSFTNPANIVMSGHTVQK